MVGISHHSLDIEKEMRNNYISILHMYGVILEDMGAEFNPIRS